MPLQCGTIKTSILWKLKKQILLFSTHGFFSRCISLLAVNTHDCNMYKMKQLWQCSALLLLLNFLSRLLTAAEHQRIIKLRDNIFIRVGQRVWRTESKQCAWTKTHIAYCHRHKHFQRVPQKGHKFDMSKFAMSITRLYMAYGQATESRNGHMASQDQWSCDRFQDSVHISRRSLRTLNLYCLIPPTILRAEW